MRTICRAVKSIFLKAASNRYLLRVTVLAATHTGEQTIVSNNKTQELLQQLLVKPDALYAKLTNIKKSLKIEII